VDIDLKSFRFTTVPNCDSMLLLSLENVSRIRPIQHLFKYAFGPVKFQVADLFRCKIPAG
jgi:hypothetical protein